MKIYNILKRGPCLLLACIATVIAIPNRPPGIYLQPDKDIYFKASETVELPCRAIAEPAPRYYWKKNGIDFNPSGNDDRIVQYAQSGTMVISRPEAKDEGIFQCFAENEYGISVTVNVNLREALIVDFPVKPTLVHSVQLGSYVTLNCVPPTSFPKASVEWVLRDSNGQTTAINYDNRVTMDLEARLHITNVQRGDVQGGKAYVCVAINYDVRKNTYDRGHIIELKREPETKPGAYYIWASPTDHFGLRGKELQLKCIFGGNPTPEVYWLFPNKTNPYTVTRTKPDKVTQSLGGLEITIPNLQNTDAGAYECRGQNSQGVQVTRNFRIRVESIPYWVTEPHDIETSIGAKATFICNATGKPEPNIFWYINGVPLADSTHPTVKSNRFLKPNKNNITIVNLNKNDAMVLQCNASNKHGYVFADMYLNVLEEAPQFLEAPHNTKTSEGQAVNMTCRTSGKPDPTITWFKEGDQITGGRYQTLLNGNLHIENVVLSDAGNYTCTAENFCGKNCGKIEGNALLIVRRRTRIESKPSDLELSAGKDGKFTCSGTTDFAEVDHLQVYWKKDGKTITSNDQRMTQNFQDNSLTISGTIARDSGVYTCVVTNGIDEATSSAILTVKDRPDPPIDVKAECSQTQAIVTWTKGASNNAPIQFFEIQYNTSFASDLWVDSQREGSTQNKAYVPLSPWVKYTFRVIATNKIGKSEPSYHTTKVCETLQQRPSKNPENVRDIGDTPNYLVIEWTPMPEIEHNGPNFNYIVTITRAGTAPISPITESNWQVSRYDHRTDDIYTPYNVTVKARNNVGESSAQLTNHVLYSAEWKPTISVNVFKVLNARVEATSATFSWEWDMSDNNDPNKIKGRFRGFKIQYWRRGAKLETFREMEVPESILLSLSGNRRRRSVPESHLASLYTNRHKRAVNTLQTTVSGLSPYIYMEAQIVVVNTYYAGPPSAIVSFQTKEGVPGPVRSFSTPVKGSNFVKLSWQLPDLMDRNGIIRGFDIAYQTVNGLELGKMQDRDPQIDEPYVNNTVLNGLVQKQKYRIHIYARTMMGRGEGFFIEVVTEQAGSQNVPSFYVKNLNSTFFNVTWTELVDKQAGTVVYIEYRKEGASDWQQSTDEVAKTWKGISDLESGTSYQIRLVVTNGKDRAESGIQTVRTMGVAAAYSLAANFGWFIGMIISLLIIIGIGVLIYFLRKKAMSKPPPERKYNVSPKDTKPMYSRDPEPKGYSNEYYNRDSDYDHDSIHKRSTGSLDKGYNNRTYGDEKYGFDEKDGKRYDDYDNRDSYDRRYDDDYDDRYDDDRYDDDRYDDYDRRYDDYDKRDSSYDKRDDYDDKRYSDYDDRRISDRYDKEPYPDDGSYEPYERRRDDREYDRRPSYDDRRPISDEIEDYNAEPSKFDADGYPREVKRSGGSTPPKNGTPSTSTFV